MRVTSTVDAYAALAGVPEAPRELVTWDHGTASSRLAEELAALA